MYNFQVGDRVKCISSEADSERVFGDSGTIWVMGDYPLHSRNLRVCVEWDNFAHGHAIDSDNPCKKNHGWWVYARTLQLIAPVCPDVDINFTEDDIL